MKKMIVGISVITMIVLLLSSFYFVRTINDELNNCKSLIEGKDEKIKTLVSKLEEAQSSQSDLENKSKEYVEEINNLTGQVEVLTDKIGFDNTELTKKIDSYEKDYLSQHPEHVQMMNMNTANTHLIEFHDLYRYIRYNKNDEGYFSMSTQFATGVNTQGYILTYNSYGDFESAKIVYREIEYKFVFFENKWYMDTRYKLTPFGSEEARTGYYPNDNLQNWLFNPKIVHVKEIDTNVETPDINDWVDSEMFDEMTSQQYGTLYPINIGKSIIQSGQRLTIDMYEVIDWKEENGMLTMNVIIRSTSDAIYPEKLVDENRVLIYDGASVKWGGLDLYRSAD